MPANTTASRQVKYLEFCNSTKRTPNCSPTIQAQGNCQVSMFRCNYWALDTADWTVEEDGGCAIITPPDEAADLRITTCDFACGLSDAQLLAWARQRVPEGTAVTQADCGQFAGVTYALVDAKGTYWREWLLTLAEVVLLVSYCSEQGNEKSHSAIVERMLSTLIDNRA